MDTKVAKARLSKKEISRIYLFRICNSYIKHFCVDMGC